ncbi:uncharacterized protein LOC144099183 isoform X2 [Amblyomma americanum]
MAASTLMDALCKKPDLLQEEFGKDSEDRKSKRKDQVDSFRHKKLLDAIGSLGGKKKVTPRTEPSLTVSEYDLSKASVEQVAVHQLLAGLKKTSKHRQIKKQVRSIVRNAKVLPKPLPRPELQRAQRQVAYDKVSEEVSVWEPVVNDNRMAEQLRFPLKQADMRMECAQKFVERMKPRTELEREINKILKVSENVARPGAELTPAEEKALKAMSLEEAKERLAELKKMRALLSYQEMKARRQGKIKSKKYHRILKKERLKKQMKEFEELKEKDPELAIEKLRELDKQRILERVSLRHKSTGKWAKQQMLRTKYNQESREALLTQLELSRQLTQKPLVESSDDEEGVDVSAAEEAAARQAGELEARFFNAANPWLKNTTGTRPRAGAGSADGKNGSAASLRNDLEGENEEDGGAVANVAGKSGNEAEIPDCSTTEGAPSDCPQEEQMDSTAPSDASNKTTARANSGNAGVNGQKEEAEVEDPLEEKQAEPGSVEAGPERKLASKREKVGARVKKRVKSASKTRMAEDIDKLFDSLDEPTAKKRKAKRSDLKLKRQEKGKKKSVSFKETDSGEGREKKSVCDPTAGSADDLEDVKNEAQLSETLERRQTLSDLEALKQDSTPGLVRQKLRAPQSDVPSAEPEKVEVDPTKFLEVKQQVLRSKAPDLSGPADEALDDEEAETEQVVTIAEAFADDDVISAFR